MHFPGALADWRRAAAGDSPPTQSDSREGWGRSCGSAVPLDSNQRRRRGGANSLDEIFSEALGLAEEQ